MAEILSTAYPGEIGTANIDTKATTIDVTVPHGIPGNHLYTFSGIASAAVDDATQISGETANNFTTPGYPRRNR